jgi:pyruvate dehydrogenase E1 component alpha subunit
MWRQRDPITKLRAELIESGQASEDELNAIDAEVDRQVEDAVRFADESPEPAMEELWTDVYVGVARETHHG